MNRRTVANNRLRLLRRRTKVRK